MFLFVEGLPTEFERLMLRFDFIVEGVVFLLRAGGVYVFLLRFVVMVEVFEGLLIGLVLPPMVLVAVVERCIGFASGFETLA